MVRVKKNFFLSSGLRKTFVWIRIWIHQKLAPDPDLTLKEKLMSFGY